MAPVIRSRYEQYKRDTQQFTTWLAQTAISLGYPLSKFDQAIDDDVEVLEQPPKSEEAEVNIQSPTSKKNAKKKARRKENARLEREVIKGEKGNGMSHGLLDESIPRVVRPIASRLAQEDTDQGNDPSEFLPNGSSAQEGQKPAGKPAKEGLKGEKQKPSPSAPKASVQPTTPSGLPGQYTLKLSLYIEVVQYIVDQGASIPTELIRILRRCISLRLKTSRQFIETSDLSNQSHRYFIDILVKVRVILECVNSTTIPTSPIPMHNQFGELSADDSDDDAEDVPDIDLPRVASAMPHASFEPEFLKVEAISAVVMFLGDMERVRAYILALWKDYKSGSVDLITAAVTTNSAIDILQHPHDELMKRVMPIFGHDFRIMLIYIFGMIRGQTTGRLDLNMRMYDLIDERDLKLGQTYDFMMIPIVQIFRGLADILNSGKMPLVQSGRYGKYDPNASFDKLSRRARWQQHHVLLAELFSDSFCQLGFASGEPQDYDALTMDAIIRRMDHFISTQEISFHLTFAMRVYVDINFTLGADTGRGRQYLHDTARRMLECLKSRPALEGPIPLVNWHEYNDGVIESLIRDATFCSTFDLRKLKNTEGLEKADWLLVERHPLLCALFVFRLQIVYSEVGLGLANTFTSIQSAAHLYQACQHSSRIPEGKPLRDWIDMEFVMQLHGKEEAFGGRIPTTIDDSNRAFQLVAGFSNHIVDGKRVTIRGAVCNCRHKCGLKGFLDQTKILSIYKKKFSENPKTTGQDDMSEIEALLRDPKAGEEKAARTINQRKSGRRGYQKEKKHSTSKFSIIKLLSVLERGLQQETTSIRFDYLSMHLRCLEILRAIRNATHPYLVKKLGSGYIENDTLVSSVTGWILRFETFEMERAMGYIPGNGKPPSRLLSTAGDVFHEILGTGNEGQEETLMVQKHRNS